MLSSLVVVWKMLILCVLLIPSLTPEAAVGFNVGRKLAHLERSFRVVCAFFPFIVPDGLLSCLSQRPMEISDRSTITLGYLLDLIDMQAFST